MSAEQKVKPVSYRWRYKRHDTTWTDWMPLRAEEEPSFRQVQHMNLTTGLVQCRPLYDNIPPSDFVAAAERYVELLCLSPNSYGKGRDLESELNAAAEEYERLLSEVK